MRIPVEIKPDALPLLLRGHHAAQRRIKITVEVTEAEEAALKLVVAETGTIALITLRPDGTWSAGFEVEV